MDRKQALENERAWLELLQANTVVSVSLLDADRWVHRVHHDPRLRAALESYLTERIQELSSSERIPNGMPGRPFLPAKATKKITSFFWFVKDPLWVARFAAGLSTASLLLSIASAIR